MKELVIQQGFEYSGYCGCNGGADKYKHNSFPEMEIRVYKKGYFTIRYFDKEKKKGDHTNFNMIYEHFLTTIPQVS